MNPARDAHLAAGVDVVDVPRFAALVARRGGGLHDQVFTAAELADCHGRVPSLAARFAAKEAVAKALGVGIGKLRWRDVEVRETPEGRPTLNLTGTAAKVANDKGVVDWAISLSHTDRTAVAIAVASASTEEG
jgi:holo-[acyl-carrier protein] synthase